MHRCEALPAEVPIEHQAENALKNLIPIRGFGDSDELRPGFVEVDLVPHEGGNARGDYAYTLDAADMWTGWTEAEVVSSRAEKWIFAGLEKAKASFRDAESCKTGSRDQLAAGLAGCTRLVEGRRKT